MAKKPTKNPSKSDVSEPAAPAALEWRDPADLRPYAENPRENDAAVSAVAASIAAFGFRQPIVVDAAGVIIVGHTRWKAAITLRLARVPVHVAADLTADEARAYRIADNKTAELSSWHTERLSQELQALEDVEWSRFGFTEPELAKYFADRTPAPADFAGIDATTNLQCPQCGYQWSGAKP